MTLRYLGTALAALALAGCGAESKMAEKPTDEMIAADKAHQKQIEDEERGTPVKPAKPGRRS